MIDMKCKNNRAGNSLIEYALILGLAAMVFTGMNIYIKRGMQGKVQEMTDFFISNKQEGNINPTAETSSSSNVAYSANFGSQMLTGGGTKTALSDATTIGASSTTIDKDIPSYEKNSSTVTPAEAGTVAPPNRQEQTTTTN